MMKMTPELERSVTRMKSSLDALAEKFRGQPRDSEGQFASGGSGAGASAASTARATANDPKQRAGLVKKIASTFKGVSGKASAYVGKQIKEEWKFHADALKGLGKMVRGKKPTRKEVRNIVEFAAHTAVMAAFPGASLAMTLGGPGAFIAKKAVSSVAFRTVDMAVSKVMGVTTVLSGKSFTSMTEEQRKTVIIGAIQQGIKEAMDTIASGKIPDYVWDEI